MERAISVREIVALSYAADRTAADKLREAAVASEDPATRRAALSALAGIAGPQNLHLFIRSGLVDADQSSRIEAARAIARLIGDRGRTIVEAAAAREHDPTARDIMRALPAARSWSGRNADQRRLPSLSLDGAAARRKDRTDLLLSRGWLAHAYR